MSNEQSTTQAEIAQLRLERDKLREKLTAIEADYRKGLSADSEDRAVELENADVLDAIARATAEELEQIEQRLSELSLTKFTDA